MNDIKRGEIFYISRGALRLGANSSPIVRR